KVAQSLYTRALDHFISFLAVKDRIITRENEKYIDICHFFTKSLHTLYFQQNESQHSERVRKNAGHLE
ncbi:hypothetical protein, partial [uncultured Holdemanella sp.]|uniref:hypothetical protein n=1 Tax=uncultured Holdemanella sp. TaxID=1763549 RepID=UPI0025831DCC